MKSKILFSTLSILVFITAIYPTHLASAGKPDLIIHLINVLPYYKPCTSDNIEFQITVKNIGTANANASVVGVRVGGGSIRPLPVPAINPGKTQTVYLRNIKLSTPQKYRITAYADHNNQINEQNEGNNSKFKSFEVIHGSADLAIDKIYINPTDPIINANITAYLKVKNIGSCKSEASVVALRIGGSTTLHTYPVPELGVNADHLVRRNFVLKNAGNFRITAYCDHQNQVSESNENNNSKYHSFRVRGSGVSTGWLSDLVISVLSITPSKPRTSDNINFQITVKNIGTADANASVVGVRVGGGSIRTLPVPAINLGKTQTVYLRNIKLSTPQNYRVTAYADYSKQVNERDENNNSKYKSFTVVR